MIHSETNKEIIFKKQKNNKNNYPKYLKPILNLIINISQINHKKNIGNIVQMFEDAVLENDGLLSRNEWKIYLKKNHAPFKDENIELSVDKCNSLLLQIYCMIGEILHNGQSKDFIRDYINNLYFDGSYDGLSIQMQIINHLKEYNYKVTQATSLEESQGIDVWIDNIPVQIKPKSYKFKDGQCNVKNTVFTIFYEKNINGFTLDCDFNELNSLIANGYTGVS